MAVHFETFSRIEMIDKGVWNQFVAAANPMLEWEYFYCLEKSGCVSPARGYFPNHLVAYIDKQPVAIAPLYERDRAWVEFGDGGLIEFLTELTGIPFNLGVVGTIPFTPVPGYRFLHSPAIQPFDAYKMLLDYIDYYCETQGLSTSRIYFVSKETPTFHSLLSDRGYVCLKSAYCEWFNRGYHNFQDYLMSFKSNRRRKIKREIRAVRENGVEIEMVPGTAVPENTFDDMYGLYLRTWRKHMGDQILPFLNAEFFNLLGRTFSHRTSFSIAAQKNKRVAMAIFYEKGESIYGRYWGCYEEIPFLHFAACYYHPIKYAIEHRIHEMDPGFGGEHKMIRGYEPVPVYHYVKFYGEQQRRIANLFLKRIHLTQVRTSQRV